MPLDEEFLRDRIDLRARRSRDRGRVASAQSRVRDLYTDRAPELQAEFTDQSGASIIGLGTIDGMVT